MATAKNTLASRGHLSADVAIIGAGIMGLSAAFYLRQRGKQVVVLERGEPGREASGLNGGGVRQQGRLRPELPLALAAVQVWQGLEQALGHPLDYRQRGHLYLAETDEELSTLAVQRDQELQLGLHTELLTPSQLKELAPGLAGHFSGGKYCPSDGSADPVQTMRALTAACRDAGVHILTHTSAKAIGVENGRATHVITDEYAVQAEIILNAAGPWAPHVAQFANVYLPIYPSRAELALTEPLPLQAIPFVQTFRQDFGGAQNLDGSVRYGASATRFQNRFTYDKTPSADLTYLNGHRAAALFPALANARIARRWVGIRECTPDMMPILGPVDGLDGLFIAAGFSGHGYCLGPYAGQLIAEWICTGRTEVDLSAFDLARFQKDNGPFMSKVQVLEQTG